MIHNFTYYLHDDYEMAEIAEFMWPQLPDMKLSRSEFMDKLGYPFAEVTLQCTFDDVTGNVEIVSAAS